jgi:hypothetical protein
MRQTQDRDGYASAMQKQFSGPWPGKVRTREENSGLARRALIQVAGSSNGMMSLLEVYRRDLPQEWLLVHRRRVERASRYILILIRLF